MFSVWVNLTKYFKLKQVVIDNFVFRLHYKATFLILLASSILLTVKDSFGSPILCTGGEKKGMSDDFVNTYCWITTTYTVHLADHVVNGTSLGMNPDPEDLPADVKEHKYYQWVCLVLFLQAMLFTIPRSMWKYLEGGLVKLVVQDMSSALVDSKNGEKGIKIFVDKDEMQKRIDCVVNYFIMTKGTHDGRLFKLIICEVLNFVNVLAQMVLMDWFLDGEFKLYGFEVLGFLLNPLESRMDPMSKVFPKMTKCKLQHYGPGGQSEIKDFMCTLPLNVVNEKTYALIWFWFAFLAVISGLHLLYRFISMICYRSIAYHRLKLINRCCSDQMTNICNYFGISDLHILCQFKRNIEPLMYESFVANLYARIEKNRPQRESCHGIQTRKYVEVMVHES